MCRARGGQKPSRLVDGIITGSPLLHYYYCQYQKTQMMAQSSAETRLQPSHPSHYNLGNFFPSTSTGKQLGRVGFMNKDNVYHLLVNHSGEVLFEVNRLSQMPHCVLRKLSFKFLCHLYRDMLGRVIYSKVVFSAFKMAFVFIWDSFGFSCENYCFYHFKPPQKLV